MIRTKLIRQLEVLLKTSSSINALPDADRAEYIKRIYELPDANLFQVVEVLKKEAEEMKQKEMKRVQELRMNLQTATHNLKRKYQQYVEKKVSTPDEQATEQMIEHLDSI